MSMKKIDELIKILKATKKIYILGHDNIDVDSFLSGVLLSNLLTFLKIPNEFIILEKVKESETYQIVYELFHIDMKNYYTKTEDSSRNLLLEDHYETTHLGNVIACIDHHPSRYQNKYPFHYSRISCSTSYMVYELMQEAGYIISEIEAKMILVSMMIDTVSFKNKKTVEEEVLEAKNLAKQYGLDYRALEKYCLCLTPIDKYSITEIINHGYKYYQYSGNKVKSSFIQVYEMPRNEQILDWINEITKLLNVESIKMWVFIIFECKLDETYEYRITENAIKLIKSDEILSRGTNIMPKIEKLFS